ncbi:hypothetical protein DMUE_4881, partial [Dictyocoela muelleri]
FYLNENNYDLKYLLKEFLGIELKSEGKNEKGGDFVKNDCKDEMKNQEFNHYTKNKNYYAHQNCSPELGNEKARINRSIGKYFQRGNPPVRDLIRNLHSLRIHRPKIINQGEYFYTNPLRHEKEEETSPFVMAKNKKTEYGFLNHSNNEIFEQIKEYLGVDKPKEYIESIINQINVGKIFPVQINNRLVLKSILNKNIINPTRTNIDNVLDEIIVHIPHGNNSGMKIFEIKEKYSDEISPDDLAINFYHDITEEDKKLLKDEIFCEKRRTIFNKYLANHLQPYYKLCVYFDGWYLITEKSERKIEINEISFFEYIEPEKLNIAFLYDKKSFKKLEKYFFKTLIGTNIHNIPLDYIKDFNSEYVKFSSNYNFFVSANILNLLNFKFPTCLTKIFSSIRFEIINTGGEIIIFLDNNSNQKQIINDIMRPIFYDKFLFFVF